jgi:hypothetical protein
MKKLIIAVAAMLAATLFSGNAFAFTGGHAKGVQTSNALVKVHHGYCHRRPYRYRIDYGYRPAPCCSCYTCSPCCGAGWGPGWGGGWGGFPVTGWWF